MNYIQINLKISPQYPWAEVITQELSSIGFESFMEEDEVLQAYINEENFNTEDFNLLLRGYKEKGIEIEFEQIFIPSQNWNATWEADYHPVKFEKELLIRAPFHKPDDSFKLSVEIQPQMSFGTGHHQTTYLLCETLLTFDFTNKKVLDVGTGTGVLGILASLLGAESVVGTDIESGAIENTIENCERNNITNFTVLKGDIEVVPKTKFDVIIANINKNVLIDHLEDYSQLITQEGVLFLSGFFENDAPSIIKTAEKFSFIFEKLYIQEKWAVLKLLKK